MTTTQEIVAAWFRAWQKGDYHHLPVTDSFTHTSPFGTIVSKSAYLKLVEANTDKFLGYTFEILDAMYHNEKACVRYKAVQKEFEIQVSEWYYLKGNLIERVVADYHIGELRDDRKLRSADIQEEPHVKIAFLDHVAIRAENPEASAKWYEQVLGLKKYQLPEWGPYPIFMLSGKSGIAIFPANTKDPAFSRYSKNVKIDHFAFNVTGENFKIACKYFDESGIPYHLQDHFYFHSIYLKDPDEHTVELTTLRVKEEDFY